MTATVVSMKRDKAPRFTLASSHIGTERSAELLSWVGFPHSGQRAVGWKAIEDVPAMLAKPVGFGRNGGSARHPSYGILSSVGPSACVRHRMQAIGAEVWRSDVPSTLAG